MKEKKMSGIERIAAERKRQIKKLGYNASHDADDDHEHGELALVACLYATPHLLYVQHRTTQGSFMFNDPWPSTWDNEYDKRERDDETDAVKDPKYTAHDRRIRNLEKAGALIAAEIDRLVRLGPKKEKS